MESSPIREYDVVIIGSGGGMKMSDVAASLNFRVALCERDKFGGTCLNRGCTPSKMLIHAAELADSIHEFPRFGIDLEKKPSIRFSDIVHRVSHVIDEESSEYLREHEENKNIDVYLGEAYFIDDKTVCVDGALLRGRVTIINVGARPSVPPISGLQNVPYLTSSSALRLDVLPSKMCVLGASYIGCELSYFFQAMGTEITMFSVLPFIPFEDDDIIEEFVQDFSRRVTCKIGFGPKKFEYDEQRQKFIVYWDEGGTEFVDEFDQVLCATGIRPNSDSLRLENTTIETKRNGFIVADKCLRTAAPNVYAIGDCVGNYIFRHSVNFEVEYLYEHLLVNDLVHDEVSIHYGAVPHAVFSHPQIASCGLTEREAREQGLEFVCAKNYFKQSVMGMALQSENGFCKFVVERGTRKILGVHIIGPNASILIHEVLPIMRVGGLLDDILLTIHIHPSLSEVVRNAARRAKKALLDAGDEIPGTIRMK